MPADELTLEMWTDVATLGNDVPVTYPLGSTVTHGAVPYLCVADPCAAGVEPGTDATTWELLPPFTDDVRAVPGSTWEDVGPSANEVVP